MDRSQCRVMVKALSSRIAVIKIGSNTLVRDGRSLDLARLDAVATELALAVADGWQPVLVSSMWLPAA